MAGSARLLTDANGLMCLVGVILLVLSPLVLVTIEVTHRRQRA